MCCGKPMGMGSLNPHEVTAISIFGVLTEDSYGKAKLINYGEAYGMGEVKLGRIAGQYPIIRREQESVTDTTCQQPRIDGNDPCKTTGYCLCKVYDDARQRCIARGEGWRWGVEDS